MEKTWLKHYPKGVPASIDVEQYTSLVALIEESFKKYRDLPAYKFMGKTITFGQVDDLSRAVRTPMTPEFAEQLRLLVANASDILALVDAFGTIRFVSDAVREIGGYEPATLAGTRFFDLLHPDEVADAQASFLDLIGLKRAGFDT